MSETNVSEAELSWASAAGREPYAKGRPVDRSFGDTIAVLWCLSRRGATTSPDDLSDLLGITPKRARRLLDIISTETLEKNDEVKGPLVSLCEVGTTRQVRRLIPAEAQLPALRLTPNQAEACAHALDVLGAEKGSELRERVERSFFPIDSPSASSGARGGRGGGDGQCRRDGQGGQVTDNSQPLSPQLDTLVLCALSLVRAKPDEDGAMVQAAALTFGYQGSNDSIVRTRRVVPLNLRLQDETWLMDGFDLDARGTRSFLVPLMQTPRLSDTPVTVPLTGTDHPDGGTVTLLCSPTAARAALSWEGARQDGRDGDRVRIIVPYYRGDWLPRRLLALGEEVSHTSKRLEREMRDIANADLRNAERLRRRLAAQAEKNRGRIAGGGEADGS